MARTVYLFPTPMETLLFAETTILPTLPPEEALINVHRMPANSNTTSIVVELRMGTGV